MDVAAFLEEICALPGFSGMEGTVAARIAEEFKKYSDDVHIDKMGNVRAIMGQGEPRVMVAAHMDEVGLLVSTVEDNGFIRLYDTYMLDPRILPGSEVTVWGKEPLYGVIGVKPPHLTNGPHKAATVDELAVDVGLPAEEVRQLVKTGDMVTFKVPMTKLMNNRVAYKTFDDRACVACMILAMKELSEQKLHCTVEFVATVQEEVGCRGAKVSSYDIDPVMAVAFDVCHAITPGTDPWDTVPIEKVSVAMGPTIHPAMFKRMCDTARDLKVDIQVEPSFGRTGTDADSIFKTRMGIPTCLLSLPLSYMHTMVETISLNTCKETGRLLAGFLRSIDEKWEEWLCF